MPKLSREELERTVKAYVETGGNQTQAAKTLGIGRSALRERLDRAQQEGITWEIPESIPPVVQVNPRPVVRVRAITPETAPSGPIIRVLGIGDPHDSPSLPDKSRFEWIGKHIEATQPDYVVDIGDSCTFDSLCSYAGNDTYEGKLKPSVQADLDSYDKAMFTMYNACPSWKGQRIKTQGNHEDRIKSFENRNPEVFGMIGGEYRRIAERYEIQETPYGEFRFIGGVGFIHTPLTQMGKPYNAKTLSPIANDATFDIVFGHTHKQQSFRAPKIGPQNYVKIVNLGCALPWGHVEDYAAKATTGWWWGVVELKLQGGHVISEHAIPMPELERWYA